MAVAGYYGFGNLGDELLAEAAITALLRCGVEKERIVLMSAAPEESRQKFGVDSINRWKVLQVCGTLRQSETLLLGGGGLFQDVSSLLSCFYYWWLVRAACFCGAVPWAIGQSFGPFSTRTGPRLTRDALKRCRAVQVRDAASEALCASLGLTVETGGDLALSLADSFISQAGGGKSKSPARLLVNLRPGAGAQKLSERLADAISACFYSSSFGGELVGVALSDEDERLMSRFNSEGRLPLSRIERIAALPDALRVFSGSAAVGMRLHFVMLAALAQIPLVAVPYDPKVESFAVGQNIPLWRDGALPPPRPASFPRDFSPGRVRGEIDALCRKALYIEP
ncbi:MAG: polysaccharide pyruvyl transferase family protein [Synergistaceae bacterium]|nr:polysaccharide pyruvyl transferase family protein [Synergistaceae bacterium]